MITPLSVLDVSGRHFPVCGAYEPGFERVFAAYLESFRLGEEIGSAVAITRDGRSVVDLWGGFTGPFYDRPWERDTIVTMMSVAKGICALCVHMLVDRGVIALDEPVARYWPEFEQAGKDKILLRHLLDHRAGLPVLVEPLYPGALFDRAVMTEALARQPPLLEPGGQPAYHVVTMGYLTGEVVRRVSGRTLGNFLRQEIAMPLKIDYAIGLAPNDVARCADFVRNDKNIILHPASPERLMSKVWAQLPIGETFNSHPFRTAEIPAINGHGNARAMARLYGVLACGGEQDGVRIISSEALAQATEPQWCTVEALVGKKWCMGLGFILNMQPEALFGPNQRSFGAIGVGGSTAFADPDAKLGFAYSMNKMFDAADNGPRARRLIDAMYACI